MSTLEEALALEDVLQVLVRGSRDVTLRLADGSNAPGAPVADNDEALLRELQDLAARSHPSDRRSEP